MKIETYLKEALNTEAGAENGVHFRLEHATLGFITEAGELVDIVKKSEIYGKDFDTVNAGEEVGDMMWYAAIAAAALDCADLLSNIAPAKIDHGYDGFRNAAKQLHREAIAFDDATNVYKSGRPTMAKGRTNSIGTMVNIISLCHGICDALELDFESILETNILKLKARYPEKFDANKAIERDLKAEREILEAGVTTEDEVLVETFGPKEIYRTNVSLDAPLN